MKKCFFLSFIFFVGLFACRTDELDFAPIVIENSTYNFNITHRNSNSTVRYNLIDVKHYSTERINGDYQGYVFMMSGKDKNTQADVHITGDVWNRDLTINVAIIDNGVTTFYKNCNNFRCEPNTIDSSSGRILKLSNFGFACLTTTLSGSGSMNNEVFLPQFNTMTFSLTK